MRIRGHDHRGIDEIASGFVRVAARQDIGGIRFFCPVDVSGGIVERSVDLSFILTYIF
jgi:hypothetical protein